MKNEETVCETIQAERQLLPWRLLIYLTTSSLLFVGFVTSTSLCIQRLVASIGLVTVFAAFFQFLGVYLRLKCLKKGQQPGDSERRKGFLKGFSGTMLALVWFPLIFLALWSVSLASTIYHWL